MNGPFVSTDYIFHWWHYNNTWLEENTIKFGRWVILEDSLHQSHPSLQQYFFFINIFPPSWLLIIFRETVIVEKVKAVAAVAFYFPRSPPTVYSLGDFHHSGFGLKNLPAGCSSVSTVPVICWILCVHPQASLTSQSKFCILKNWSERVGSRGTIRVFHQFIKSFVFISLEHNSILLIQYLFYTYYLNKIAVKKITELK